MTGHETEREEDGEEQGKVEQHSWTGQRMDDGRIALTVVLATSFKVFKLLPAWIRQLTTGCHTYYYHA